MKDDDLVDLLRKNGWELNRIKGSHHIMVKNGQTLSVPVHHKDMKPGLLNKILKSAGLK